MSTIHQWAIRHGVPAAALFELQVLLGERRPELPGPVAHEGKSEAFVQSLVKLRASQEGVTVTRNNVGALIPKDSKRPIRFGLFNESEEVNDLVKSADLIGWRPLLIVPAMVGTRVAQFWARECKEAGWTFGADPDREIPQKAFLDMVNGAGGDAAFSNGSEYK